ncbi:(deoxy)nucleoside triphosphate pyrophosphohydrolase [Leifsonia sp. NPDC077715]|uniref:(deoxy)nucleoside triphosphate pyrophosphohydrolase n=1 Tax=Leifsonia sp. NPDC077715 TaxID=3155539 RepID=UPI003434778B
MQPLLVVAAVIRSDDGGRVLACRRAPGKDAAGRWEFPGGKVEAGEAPEAALAREIGEELGVGIRVGALLDRTVTVRPDGRAIDLACYDCRLDGAAPVTSTDHDDLRWVDPAELEELRWAEADLPVVRMLAAGALPGAGGDETGVRRGSAADDEEDT